MHPFRYAEPESVAEACRFLKRQGTSAMPIAGGTDLLSEIKDGVAKPESVLNLKRLPSLAHIREQDGALRIGGMTTLSQLQVYPVLRRNFRIIEEALSTLATPQIRAVGTVAGNLCQRPRCLYYRHPLFLCAKKGGTTCFALDGDSRYHAILQNDLCPMVHPSDLAPAFIALEAQVLLAGPEEKRLLPLEEFFLLPGQNLSRETVLKPGEILVEVRVPKPKAGTRGTYLKFRERGAGDFALVSAACSGRVLRGTVAELRLVLGGVAPIPFRARQAEEMLMGQRPKKEFFAAAAQAVLAAATPLSGNRYKIEAARTLMVRAMQAVLK
ncbi:MAG: xanthine dehydrogenase family protein subunit M [Candidatus Tectomicrobia bacterium]|uniref:Xanthine dehydrogenase family protein subunit M n=1 Tax=Tectimicrobiota bacterium TaxID=2528274 RepID=A0A932GRL8_UNCTE|nr:xanthine dehydrogenase family protein subunit M [Candidatus Tectomicrobia bacterium]